MFEANYFYGHSEILAEYVGIEKAPWIQGHLQHGWNLNDGFGGSDARRYDSRRFVWSSIFERRGHALGYRDYNVIGSPWSYLCSMKNEAIEAASVGERRGTLYFPFHGWERAKVVGNYQTLIDTIRETEGDASVTVCLYWLEYEDSAVRSLFENSGFRVITNGHRDATQEDVRNQFLDRQLQECLAHEKVASNRLCTALLYGASVGCDAGIYGDPMNLESAGSKISNTGSRDSDLYPELFDANVPNSLAGSIAQEQLGMGGLLDPVELALTLGWEQALDERVDSR